MPFENPCPFKLSTSSQRGWLKYAMLGVELLYVPLEIISKSKSIYLLYKG